MTSVSGIYELQGDRLTMCFGTEARMGMGGSAESPPPTKLAAGPKSALVVLKRVSKPAAENRSPEPPAETSKDTALQFGPVIGHFPQGTVELVGITNYPPTNQSWWAPDGSPVDVGPLKT